MGEKSKTVGVVLLNMGGPDSLEAVRPFLYNLFSDRQIIRLGPPFLQRPLACLISSIRSKKTGRMYSLIGGKSPILEITNAQARALEEVLNADAARLTASGLGTGNSELDFRVYVGMRYWRPFIEDVISGMCEGGIRRVVALSLYPHYSLATSGSSLAKFEEAASNLGLEYVLISEWYDHPLYIEALVDVIRKGLESFSHGSDVHVLFSAHSLPQKFVDRGDPYVEHIKRTIEKIVKLIPVQWHLSYQSRSGPVKWLKPSTEEKLKELSANGVRRVLMVPISFVSDHIETLYEMDILYANLAKEFGITLHRAAALNTHPLFIEALRDIVGKGLSEAGWRPA
ncbi:MAG: ferrochelatase [Nitrospirota bacterium]